MNYGEGRMLRGRMQAEGIEFVTSPGEADVLVLNTCGVIGFTENTMYRRIAELHSLGKRIIVTGCLANTKQERIMEIAPSASLIPPGDIRALEMLLGLNTSGMDCWTDYSSNDIIVPIAQGCLSLCTYCFSRLSRGRVRSLEAKNVVEMIRKHLSTDGTKEILLSAMDTIAYGRDIGTTLPELLKQICSLEGSFRLRVGMMNPSLLPPLLDDLLDAFSDPRIYKFFHLPFQSGSDRILRAMKRGYTAEQFISLVREIRQRYPDMTLSTDVITGFPGETDEDFAMTLGVMEAVSPDIVNVTRFSAREGTPAFYMKEQVPGWISKERSRAATALRFQLSLERNRAYLGRRCTVLLTEKGKGNTTIGRLDNYKQVVVSGIHEIGEWLECKITGCSSVHLEATPLS
jgi:threonylcarbamoyladenosine tRNA methylthiotransferase CDKAL1